MAAKAVCRLVKFGYREPPEKSQIKLSDRKRYLPCVVRSGSNNDQAKPTYPRNVNFIKPPQQFNAAGEHPRDLLISTSCFKRVLAKRTRDADRRIRDGRRQGLLHQWTRHKRHGKSQAGSLSHIP